MPAFTSTAFNYRAATAAMRAQDSSLKFRAQTEQHIIDTECCATKLALANDKIEWRTYWRKRGQRAAPFVPYMT